MPLKAEIVDIAGYYDNSWWVSESNEVQIISTTLGDLLERVEIPFERWPVRNREQRTPISPQKRAIIHERDGGICRLCGTGGHLLTVDHIIPRSAFPAQDLRAADRSDNLISACWPCNEAKSNYERDQRKRLGVTPQCWYCVYGQPEEGEDLPYPVIVPVFCGRCGISYVPDIEGWVL
jgi:hypothetical protein